MSKNENTPTKLDKETKLHISSSASNISIDVPSSKDGWNVSFGSNTSDSTSEENLIVSHFFAMQILSMVGNSADNEAYLNLLKTLGKMGGKNL